MDNLCNLLDQDVPELELTTDELIILYAKNQVSIEDISLITEVPVETLEKDYSKVISKGRAQGRADLLVAMMDSAVGGQTSVQVWLSKNYLSFKEPKTEIETTKLNVDINEVNRKIQELLEYED